MRRHPSSSSARIAVLTALICAFSLIGSAPAVAAGAFDDDDQSVHERDIDFIADREITFGCNPPANDRYCPDDSVTRGQMAAYLNRAKNLPPAPAANFGDIGGSVFAEDIARLARSGITKGCNPPANDRYCPGDDVTRGQMAAFLARTFDLEPAGDDYFTDDDNSVFEADINALAQAGVTVGCADGQFCADADVTRAQMASFLRRAITGKGVEPPTPKGGGGGGEDPPSSLPAPGDVQPPGSITVNPGDDLSGMVNARGSGAVFYLTKGVHRMESVVPKSGMEFVGAPGAIMSGAKVLEGFSRSGDHWVIGGQTQQNEQHGTCLDGYSGCIYPEQLFIDGEELWQVTSLSSLQPGSWYFDYGANQIHIADNPSGRLVETSVTDVAFRGDSSNVVIRDLVIEKYATSAQMGAVHGQEDRNGGHNQNWHVLGNEIRYNASAAVNFGDNMVVEANFLHHNGRLGIGSGRSENALATGNEISYNCVNTGFLCFGWGGGGLKLAQSNGATMRANYVHHNYGNGMAVDVQATDSTFEGNEVVDNDGAGIFVEVSSGATIRNNVLRDNGHRRPLGLGAGIVIGSSTGVTVTGNRLVGNAAGIEGLEMGREPGLSNLTVTGNTITLNGGNGYSGLISSSGNLSFTGSNIAWNNNTYDLTGIQSPFRLGGSRLSVAQWIAAGYDTSSTFK